jgi:hypothetical protein
MLTPETYAIERAAVDKADETMRRMAPDVANRGGYLPVEISRHPDYAAVDNAMRGRVNQYELLNDTPESFVAYVGKLHARTDSAYGLGSRDLTTWTGDVIGTVTLGAGWRVQSYIGSRMFQAYARVNGREFTGRTFGEGMLVSLRETAASKRRRLAPMSAQEAAGRIIDACVNWVEP